jgi:phosphate starvation-inducible PhoH-like protein
MAAQRNTGKRARRDEQMYNDMGFQAPQKVNTKFPKLEPKSYRQQDYLDAIVSKDIVFATGSAGTGKTYVATHYAAEQLYYKRIDKIIITRPAVEACGESMGFLPGELEDKFAPYLVPYLETFNELLGKSYVEYCLKAGTIEAVPLGFMRGRSFKNCLILADEMENASAMQLKLLLTRLGENTKMLINGDLAQRDVASMKGLEDAVGTLRHLSEVELITFTPDDVVRSGLCKKIIKAYG